MGPYAGCAEHQTTSNRDTGTCASIFFPKTLEKLLTSVEGTAILHFAKRKRRLASENLQFGVPVVTVSSNRDSSRAGWVCPGRRLRFTGLFSEREIMHIFKRLSALNRCMVRKRGHLSWSSGSMAPCLGHHSRNLPTCVRPAYDRTTTQSEIIRH